MTVKLSVIGMQAEQKQNYKDTNHLRFNRMISHKIYSKLKKINKLSSPDILQVTTRTETKIT